MDRGDYIQSFARDEQELDFEQDKYISCESEYDETGNWNDYLEELEG